MRTSVRFGFPYFRTLLVASALLPMFLIDSTEALAEECSHLWKRSMAIDPEGPKPMSGDTFAAYGLIGWHDEPNLRLEIRGTFPPGRFMSLQSYEGPRKRTVDHLFDSDIVPEPGSVNPYRPGENLRASPREFRADLVEDRSDAQSANVLMLDPATKIHSVFFRYYSPHRGEVPSADDLPKIYAYDTVTGDERSCPKYIDTQLDPGLVTAILRFVKKKTILDFEANREFNNGTNAAVPGYVNALTKIDYDAVSLIRFKAPSFSSTFSGEGDFNADAQVRYWSLCIQNLKESETLACLPDYLAMQDENGYVTVVVSRDPRAKKRAEELGLNFIEDRREYKQNILGFFYRNLLVRDDFEPYVGEYLPKGRVCSLKSFLAADCTL